MKRKIHGLAFAWLAGMIAASPLQAATVIYTLDNVIQDDLQQMTGSFLWTYQEGDFENGSGLFTELFIPGYGSDISALTINFDIANSIEFSLTGNINNQGLDITLFLTQALTPTQSAPIDLVMSAYSIEVGAQNGGYISGTIVPSAIPVPAAVWLFGSGLLGLAGVARRRKAL